MEKPDKNQVTFRLTDVPAEVGEDGKVDPKTLPSVTEITLKNAFVVGDIRLSKDGEVLNSWTLLDKLQALVKSAFGYEKTALSGVSFEVRAAEDIVHPDGVTGILFRKGELAAVQVRGTQKEAKIVTDKLGIAEFRELYLGTYELIETGTKEGYVREQEPRIISLAYADGDTSPVSAVSGAIDITNPRQKVRIQVTKTDADTGAKLSGAVVGLYTAEAIQNAKGDTIVSADTLLEMCETDAEGSAVFTCDLPFGRYAVKELTAPDGYELNDEAQQITFSYAGEDTACTEFEIEIKDKKKSVSSDPGSSDAEVTPLAAAPTGDSAAPELAIFGIAAASFGLLWLNRRRRNR